MDALRAALIVCLVISGAAVVTGQPKTTSPRVVIPDGYPQLAFAGSEIRTALAEFGQSSQDRTPAVKTIIVMKPDGKGKPESFRVAVSGAGKTRAVVVSGSDSSLQDIALFVADHVSGTKTPDGALTPPEVARRLDAYADAAEKHMRAAASRVTTGRGEWECTQMDLQTVAALGRYYADKVRGATELATFLVTGDESHRSAAVKYLESAAGHWKLVSDITSAHYISHEILTMGQFDWKRYLPEAEKDVQAAREMKPFYRDEQSWKWSCGQTTRAPGRFEAPDWKPEQIQWLERWLVELSLRIAPTSLPADLVKELAAEKSPSATTTLTAQRAGQAVWWLRAADVASVHVNGKTVQPVKVSKDVGKFDLATQAGNNEVRIEFERAPAQSPEIYLETRD